MNFELGPISWQAVAIVAAVALVAIAAIRSLRFARVVPCDCCCEECEEEDGPTLEDRLHSLEQNYKILRDIARYQHNDISALDGRVDKLEGK